MNHFIELAKGTDNQKYMIIHSGSRNLGKQVAEYWQNVATSMDRELKKSARAAIIASCRDSSKIEDMLKEFAPYNFPKDLTPLSGGVMDDYINDMKICQEFASQNRKVITANIIAEMGGPLSGDKWIETIHNYLDTSNKILRKGAVSAKEGELLLIPMNMADGSLLCRGKGNPNWNYSAPHGAGRIMSRTQAKKELTMEGYKDSMKGIYTTCLGRDTLDESRGAYKSMQEIIEAIGDTVDIIDILRPLYNFKATD